MALLMRQKIFHTIPVSIKVPNTKLTFLSTFIITPFKISYLITALTNNLKTLPYCSTTINKESYHSIPTSPWVACKIAVHA